MNLDNNEIFGSKNAVVISYLAKLLLSLEVGDKLETVEEISKKLNVGRGTIQTAMTRLKNNNVIKTVSRGYQGTFITYINFNKLLSLAGVHSIVGVMPLPYSKRYEGLASGIYYTLMKLENVRINLAFMQGSFNRLNALLDGRYDLMVASKQTAIKYINENYPISIAATLGEESYISNHILIVNDKFDGNTNEMKLGVDLSSDDQVFMTMNYFENQNVQIIPCKSSNVVEAILKGEIDGAIGSSGNINVDFPNLKTINLTNPSETSDNTRATIVIKKDNEVMKTILQKYLNIDKIQTIQKEVILGNRKPVY
ncbi:GntR family transcriptional regulator YhfZ [Paratissierella segnis]|jgi:hypothetical protein|uniref:GntR family transcriptional regulator n=1 Tax=Paratissierella segnis TaxID=2763679 RepID=A0A926EX22_9FIRM|nr:GntR family transcriptional regulator YhfZ [Paratissierella segnis]MBC8588004.1 GntR family transcriptional regulator [Paratissierella segnis]